MTRFTYENVNLREILDRVPSVPNPRTQQKINLIKDMRAYFNISLIQAKDLVEAIEKETKHDD